MVGFQVGPIFYKVGTSDFLYCFFSTIAYQIEGNNWGSIYPVLMNHLYKKELDHLLTDKALNELQLIKEELKKLPPEAVIWNIENLDASPPWGNNISDRITNLSNYFITSDGKDLFEVLDLSLKTAKKVKKNIKIRSL